METFIVRLWAPAPELAEEVSSTDLRGTVEHVGSRQQVRFRNAEELLEVVGGAFTSRAAQRDED